MASRISKHITKQTENLKRLLNSYSEIVRQDNTVSLDEITNLGSSFWLGRDQQEPLIPRSLRLQAITVIYYQRTTVLLKNYT